VSASRARTGDSVVSKEPLKGKRVELAPTAAIEALQTVADDFMLRIVGVEPEEYLITDLSSLYDFIGVDDMQTGEMLASVRDEYGLDLADCPTGTCSRSSTDRHFLQS
jgi:hypothetical protein